MKTQSLKGYEHTWKYLTISPILSFFFYQCLPLGEKILKIEVRTEARYILMLKLILVMYFLNFKKLRTQTSFFLVIKKE